MVACASRLPERMDFERSQEELRNVSWAGPLSVLLAVLAIPLQGLCCVPIIQWGVPILVLGLSLSAILFAWIALKNGKQHVETRIFGAIGLVLGIINFAVLCGIVLIQIGLTVTVAAALSLNPPSQPKNPSPAGIHSASPSSPPTDTDLRQGSPRKEEK